MVVLRPRGSKWLSVDRGCAPASWIEMASLTFTPPLGRGLELCALVSGLRSVFGFEIWVAGVGYGRFRHLGCWISGATVEMVVVVGHFAGGGSYQHGFNL